MQAKAQAHRERERKREKAKQSSAESSNSELERASERERESARASAASRTQVRVQLCLRCSRESRLKKSFCFNFNGRNVLGQATCRRIFGKRTTSTAATSAPTATPTATHELRLHLLSLSALAANLANNPTHTRRHTHPRFPLLVPCTANAYNVLLLKGSGGVVGEVGARHTKLLPPRAFCIFLFCFRLAQVYF